ncbi:hypothetical protein LX64_03524 [Chitinophaga skermanii]|uniref:Uncharacterized protein n=1 Tax=Chitinophaga skermanii TaxID=331697 RepID=A0A327QES7_9BACT|nr:hypothetical protein LX64_03524 [Chitinophaga skermanii]
MEDAPKKTFTPVKSMAKLLLLLEWIGLSMILLVLTYASVHPFWYAVLFIAITVALYFILRSYSTALVVFHICCNLVLLILCAVLIVEIF